MDNRTFKTEDETTLIVKHRKSAVIFEIDSIPANGKYNFTFKFHTEHFLEFLHYLEMISNKSWRNLSPKEADSLGADYYEYYDKELDNNGYLKIFKNTLFIERPSLESTKLYQFNKKKMESFIHDFKKLTNF